MRGTFIYDVRRSTLNRMLIILLVGLIAAGVGLGYAFSRLVAAQSGVTEYHFVVASPVSSSPGGELGLLLSNSGPLGGVTVYYGAINVTTGRALAVVARTNSSGYLRLAPGVRVTYMYALIDGSNRSVDITPVAVTNFNLASRQATLVFAVPNTSYPSMYSLYVAQQARFNSNFSWTYVGAFGPGVHQVRVRLDINKPILRVGLSASNSTGELLVSAAINVPQLMVSSLRSQALSEALDVFAEFFPLAGLFLVNDLFARHRSTGAIEFILARPLTKLQLITSRYTGGLVALVLSSLVTALAVTASASAFYGLQFRAAVALVAFASLLTDLAGFYSLLYLVAVLTRRSFLVIAIVLYLLLYLFNVGEVLSFILNSSWPLYLTPLSSASSILANYLRTSIFSVSYLYAAVSSAAWAVVPAALAFMIYNREAEA